MLSYSRAKLDLYPQLIIPTAKMKCKIGRIGYNVYSEMFLMLMKTTIKNFIYVKSYLKVLFVPCYA